MSMHDDSCLYLWHCALRRLQRCRFARRQQSEWTEPVSSANLRRQDVPHRDEPPRATWMRMHTRPVRRTNESKQEHVRLKKSLRTSGSTIAPVEKAGGLTCSNWRASVEASVHMALLSACSTLKYLSIKMILKQGLPLKFTCGLILT